ncbi:MAG: glycosyltransferase family 2 protein [Spirosomaceae bacterium]|jgi:hypothetical protein|nr:glycosyltransferase family 2 protein [Spirosomataceae bacterium]
MMNPKVLIIIPCYNEEESIPHLIKEILNLELNERFDVSVLVVNDCSTDKTADSVSHYNVNLLNLPINLGIGGAMQTGYLFAQRNGFDLAVQMDGDGQHPPKELIKLLNHYVQTGANVVIGSRFKIKQGFQSSRLRRLGIGYFHWLNRIFTGNSIYDSTSGFRLFDKKAIEIAAKNYPDEYPEPESLVIFGKAGLHIEEVPVFMKKRQGGKSSILYFDTIYYMIKVTIAMFFSYFRK